MVDYTFPLPKADLHRRYNPVFNSFKQGQSCTLIGLPLSARSGYLKFILEYDKKFLAEFIDPSVFFFVVIEGNLTGDQLIQSLTASLLAQNIFSPKTSTFLENYLKIHDPQLTFISLQSAIGNLINKRIVLVIYEAEKLLDNNPQAINFLVGLWNTYRNQPNSFVQLCFIGAPILLDKKNQALWNPIRPALEETQVKFELFNFKEMNYLRKRIDFLSRSKITEPIHKLAIKLSGGHTVLYRILSQLSQSELEKIVHTKTHPAIDGIIQAIWEGYSYLDKQNGEFNIPLLPPPSKTLEKVGDQELLPQLTAQQKLIFDFLVNHPGQVVSRDEIAQVIWGKLWQEKYSDWAIDRCMSTLKKRLLSTKFNIITLRNRGYQLNS